VSASVCDEVRAALLIGAADDALRAHLEACAGCREASGALASIGRELAASAPAGPPAGLRERVLLAAAPLLREQGVARRRERAIAGLRLCGAPAIALALLPFVLYVHVSLVTGLYELLASVLPRGLDVYVAGTYAIFLAGLLALTYGALPLVLARQRGPQGVRAHA
jgi:hypothetical protein